MSISIEEVGYIASLARLQFTEEEQQRLAAEMSRILAYMEQLGELDTADVPPMSHGTDVGQVVRPDVVEPRLRREEALANAPRADDRYFRVPKVIE